MDSAKNFFFCQLPAEKCFVGNEEEIRSLECTKTIADMRRSSEDERDRARRERQRTIESGRSWTCRWTTQSMARKTLENRKYIMYFKEGKKHQKRKKKRKEAIFYFYFLFNASCGARETH